MNFRLTTGHEDAVIPLLVKEGLGAVELWATTSLLLQGRGVIFKAASVYAGRSPRPGPCGSRSFPSLTRTPEKGSLAISRFPSKSA